MPEPLTPELLDRMREEATPGPWWFDGRDILTRRVSGHERSMVIPLPETFHHEQLVRHADARLAARAPTLAAKLAEAMRAMDEHCPCMGLEKLQMGDGSWQPCPLHAALASIREVEA